MSKSRMVNTRFWSDGFVVDHLNALDRYLFLYLLTNERANIIGIYELSLRTAAFETGIEKDDLTKMLQRLGPKVEYFDGWVYIRRFTDHQQTNPSVEKGMMREFFNLPHDVLNRVKQLGIDSPKLKRAFDMLDQANTVSIQPVTDSDTLPVTKPNLNLNSNSNLTKPNGKTKAADEPAAKSESKKESPIKTEDIDHLFDYWLKNVDTKQGNSKNNRAYAAKLLREHHMSEVEKMIEGVALSTSDRYAPRIANFAQLYRKWDDLIMWGKRTHVERNNHARSVKI